jgi:uncharacterized protein (TIGR02271 family)
MFDSRNEAEAAREQLRSTLGAEAQIIDQSSGESASAGESRGFWADIKDAFMPDEDRHAYQEGVSRGGFLLCANVPEDQADRACSILDQSGSVDFDSREQQWRSEGWQGYQGQPETSRSQDTERSNIVEEERIPIVEEQLRVGKREFERGGARVRSYVEERPVSETVNLHEEHVNVERRPVDQPLSSADLQDNDLLREREIEMRETAERPVIGKEARVTEEVVVQKTATDRTEQVQDTVRNTNVEVDDARGESDRSALGFDQNREPTREFEKDPSGRR